MNDAERAGAQQRLDAYAQRSSAAGVATTVGSVLVVFPARCVPLDHAAIAWAHASGILAPPTADRLGAQLVATTEGLGYTTFPVPFVWWRGWGDIWCNVAAVGRPRWRAGTQTVFVADRVPPFEGRAFELPRAAANAFMGLAVQRAAVMPPPES